MTITGDVVFLDTETTGLDCYDRVWEVAAIRRDMAGRESKLHIQVQHAGSPPPKFREDYDRRFDRSGALPHTAAASALTEFLSGRPHIVGVNPAFDAQMLERLYVDAWVSEAPPWHYHLIDLPAVTIGVLLAHGHEVELPYRSDDLAARVGAPTREEDGTPRYARHTAMGDVLWARDWFDALSLTAWAASEE
ncbi:hypothetical protein GYA93_17810 [Gordonia desulfuricans]|uniref:Exonuclease domain-containing protein n=1 Tax=Gordonia desulfuricans TaxID=89051 RepID=A0A7K3LT51_9ACTN|nr:exonuclease domain-containing protein [Gordonia desulfuricans]NDK91419.1 hypothetical protein [Gordonia desulfuricans]